MQTKAHDIVIRTLQNRGGSIVGENIKVLCPNPNHHDTRPSCYVYIGSSKAAPIGYHHCFSCGYSEHWNVVAKLKGYEEIDDDGFKVVRMSKVSQEVRNKLLPVPKDFQVTLRENGCGVTFPISSQYEWRGIHAKTLKKCGVRLSFDIQSKKTVLVLPVFINDEFRGLVKASEIKKDWEKNGYITSRGDWVKDYGLFPYDSIVEDAVICGYIVLVEGSRDALRFIQEGIPAVAILGAENWSDSKLEYIKKLGVKILVCMDGDVAGIEVSNKIAKTCKCKVYNMKKETLRYRKIAKQNGMNPESIKIDPANMPRRALERFKNWIKGVVPVESAYHQ